jgi:hypothetical protein
MRFRIETALYHFAQVSAFRSCLNSDVGEADAPPTSLKSFLIVDIGDVVPNINYHTFLEWLCAGGDAVMDFIQ